MSCIYWITLVDTWFIVFTILSSHSPIHAWLLLHGHHSWLLLHGHHSWLLLHWHHSWLLHWHHSWLLLLHGLLRGLLLGIVAHVGFIIHGEVNDRCRCRCSCSCLLLVDDCDIFVSFFITGTTASI